MQGFFLVLIGLNQQPLSTEMQSRLLIQYTNQTPKLEIW